jgi:hypothetical protein
MLPVITTTHAVPERLPATHLASSAKVKFCSRCLKVIGASEDHPERSRRKNSHRCEDRAAAHRPSVGVPFS